MAFKYKAEFEELPKPLEFTAITDAEARRVIHRHAEVFGKCVDATVELPDGGVRSVRFL